MENLKKLFGKRLRDARKAAGFKNQTDFAALVGTDQSRVSRWETGDNMPEPEYREAIHKLLGTTDDILFSAPPAPAPDPGEAERAKLIISITSKLSALDEDELGAVNALAERYRSRHRTTGSSAGG